MNPFLVGRGVEEDRKRSTFVFVFAQNKQTHFTSRSEPLLCVLGRHTVLRERKRERKRDYRGVHAVGRSWLHAPMVGGLDPFGL